MARVSCSSLDWPPPGVRVLLPSRPWFQACCTLCLQDAGVVVHFKNDSRAMYALEHAGKERCFSAAAGL